MGEFRLHAMAIDEVRDVFGADAALARHLRLWAAQTFDTEDPEHPDRTDRHGRHRGRLRARHSVRPGWPTNQDVDDLIQGRFVGPDRLSRCWRLLDEWLEHLSWGTHSLVLDAARADDLEFDLARAGVPSHLSLHRLFGGDPQIPLRPAPGMRVGYSRRLHVAATHDAMARALPFLGPDFAVQITDLVGFLGSFPSWTELAASADRPQPDLIVVWHADAGTLATVPAPAFG
ncbi:hypothetical protein [Acidipropionibacterium timonense]|uniref:hypothetical protein n=1 Tax=Acidipropionibacterium timonense TaxID=2161818 RepID=UPI001030B5D1|nr:hypothetical protein [Acidipropionibacterium timonense]